MKKRILSLLLILCMTVTLLPTAAFAEGSGDEAASPRTSVEKDNGSVHIEKSVNAAGTELTLEAYLTNEVTQTVSAKPLDIVLVLDQSGSMAYDFDGNSTRKDTERRQYAMKQAVNSFIEKAASADGTHNMAIVTFGSEAERLVGWTAVDASGASALINAINGLPQEPRGATNVGAGMQEAQKLVNSQTSTDRQKVVIVFTDGVPTTESDFDTNVANTAITAAKAMKDTGATIYTVGIFNGANPNEMYGASGFDTNSNETIGSKWAEDTWGLFPSTDFPKADRPAGNRFLNLVSSNYPNADSIGLKRETSGLGILYSGISYTVTKNFDRAGEGSYYLTAYSSSGLNTIFQQIIEEISTLGIEAGTDAVLSDTLSEYFALNIPEDTDAAKAITAEKWDCTGKDANGNYAWEKAKEDAQPTTQIEVIGKKINVTGFDYTENAVTATTKEGVTTYSGAKLVVTIPIKPDAACTAWQAGEHVYPTNSTAEGSKAGLSNYTDKDGEAVDPTLLDQSPEANVTAYSVTYTDGVTDEEIFADQASAVLPGTATPAFNGNPTREGYQFTGWEPEVEETVTENATYVAQWEETPAETFTVTYTDGVDGEEIFADQVTGNLKSGTATPAFNGNPTREGYQFTGWEPEVEETVTANATYVAQWSENSSGSGGGGSSTTYYYFAIEKIDAQDSHALNGAKFGLYLDGKQIATATSNRSGIAMFRVDESDYRKINAKSDLYYQELTAPEGYVVNSDEVSIEKSDLTTSRSKAEKDAETVRNYRGSTPDLLNGDDHFAYVIGYQDGCVHPNALITRAETATIFFRLLKDEVRDGNLRTSNTFADAADNYWANTAISTMAGLGIVQGRSSTAFDPSASITRAEFAAICARFDTGKSSGTQTFSDIKGHWAQSYIERAAELGWIKGFEDGTFRPNDCITRAQAMTMINRVLNRIPEDASDLLPDMNVWPDCNPGDWFYLAVQEATNSHNYKHKAGNYETWISMKQDPDWTRYEN